MRRWYRIVDNLRPTRNVAIEAVNKNDALDWGASLLKTTDVRVRVLKNKPKEVDHITPDARVDRKTVKKPRTAVRLVKVKSAQPMGRYKETSIDQLKRSVDFRLLQMSPCVIRWKSGKTETVSARELKKLQKTYTWTTDF